MKLLLTIAAFPFIVMVHWVASWRTPEVDLGGSESIRSRCRCAECSRYAAIDRKFDDDFRD